MKNPPAGIKWSYFVDPHTGNEFAQGDCVVIEEDCVLSQFYRRNVDVKVGYKCVLLDFLYEPNKNKGDVQKHYFRLYPYNETSIVRVLERSFVHDKSDYTDKIKDVLHGITWDILEHLSLPMN